MEQLSLFPEENIDHRRPVTTDWNQWHGCTKVSPGCMHCYMYRRDEAVGKDPSVVQKTSNFDLPVRRLRSGEHKGMYKIPSGSHIYTCFSSDFFHEAADTWRPEAWDMMRERFDCTFFMITKRPERIADHLPADWGKGWEHVTIAVTCENRDMLDKRLPGTPIIKHVAVGGESGPGARPCDYTWVEAVSRQCMENGITFNYHQTGAKLIKDGKLYNIPRRYQHSQAHKAGLDI